jgi:hypothetical protein
MSLKIVHFSLTRMAGGPWRLVDSLRKVSGHDVRLIDRSRWGWYPADLVFEEQREECVEVARAADIIHLHNYLDLDADAFAPIDFRALRREGKAILRHFRSEPNFVAQAMTRYGMARTPADVLGCELPSVVIAQYPERFYPAAMVVPNGLPISDPRYTPGGAAEDGAAGRGDRPVDLVFTPTRDNSAWADRWNTKGAPETIAMLRRLGRRRGATHEVVTNSPIEVVLEAKRRARVVLDDMVTGSYHISGLEGASLARPTLAYLDERILRALAEVTGTNDHPLINVRLEDAERVIEGLLDRPDEAAEIGRAGRAWLERWWSEERIARRFVDLYNDLLEDPARITRQEALRLDTAARRYFALDLHDAAWASRAENCRRIESVRERCARHAAAVKKWARNAIAPMLPRAIKDAGKGKRGGAKPTG